jgi:hypothetical protein
MRGEFDPALKELEKAHQLKRSSKDIAQELALLDKYVTCDDGSCVCN